MIFELDSAYKKYLMNLTGLPDKNVFVSSNAWAFRNNLIRFGSGSTPATSPVLPFCVFRVQPGGITKPDTDAYKNTALKVGPYFTDVKDRVQVFSYAADYTCTFFCRDYVAAMQVYQNAYLDFYDETYVDYQYIIDGKPFTFTSNVDFTNLELDPEYDAAEELQKGAIRSVVMDFKIQAHLFFGKGVQPVQGIVLESFYGPQIDDPAAVDRSSFVPPPVIPPDVNAPSDPFSQSIPIYGQPPRPL